MSEQNQTTKNMERVLKSETQVRVAKANLPMKGDESVQDMLLLLRKALEDKMESEYKLKDNGFISLVDVFADHCILHVYPGYKPGGKVPPCVYLKVSHERGVDGEFKFSEPVKMERKVIYVPKGQTTVVTKGDGLWSGVI